MEDRTEPAPAIPTGAADANGNVNVLSNSNTIPQPSIQVHEPERMEVDPFAKPPEVVVGTRRNANGTIGSVFSGNKIRHLKKEDGQPLWRKDIQYDFLRAVFEDPTQCFTDVDGTTGHTFAEMFIGAMQRSSKTSKVLKEKLLNEKEQATRMAMICLLVNVGRMNTTLNFFPEMRAQLRTYHAIPCLQADQDPNAQYKGLQDAPRLKSILKGASEDTEEPRSIEKIKAAPIPRTNIVNLIFVLSQDVQKVSEIHFDNKQDFFDLVIPSNVSSASRAKAFLWLMWYYMQSDFTKESMSQNPFGAGRPAQDDPEGLPIKIPDLTVLSDEEAAQENIDTPEELAFGEDMRLTRKKVLEEDETIGPPIKKTAGPSPARSEVGQTREHSPDDTPSMSRPRKVVLDPWAAAGGGLPAHLIAKSRTPREPSSPPSYLGASATTTFATSGTNRKRPETMHQKAVNQNRKMHIDKMLFKKWKEQEKRYREYRKVDNQNPLYHEIKRIYYLPEDYDSDEEQDSIGPAGVVPNMYTNGLNEADDYGAEAYNYSKVLKRAKRRLARDDGVELPSIPKSNAGISKTPQANTKPSTTSKRGPRGHYKTKARTAAAQVASDATPLGSKDVDMFDDLDLEDSKVEKHFMAELSAIRAEGATSLAEDGPSDEEEDDEEEGEQEWESDSNDEDEDDGEEADDDEDGEMTEDDFAYADPYAGVK